MMVFSVLVSCTLPWSAEETGGLYPHVENYTSLELHGPDALADRVLCESCHGVGAPPCEECHVSVPHEPPAGSATHASTESTCLDCHGVAGSIAAERAPCQGCHTTFPHPEGWVEAGGHGTVAISRQLPAVVCGNCHGSNLQGAGTAPGCAECHLAWPHPDGWNHGAAAVTDLTACGACHGTDGGGGTAGVGCGSCHLTLPHPGDWRYVGHLPVTLSVGEASCLRCHDAGDGTAGMPASCGRSCHGGAP